MNQQFLYLVFHFFRRMDFVVQPNECHDHFDWSFLCLQHIEQNVLVSSISLTHLALHLITLNGMLEAFLGNTDEDGSIGLGFFRRETHIHHPKRESRKRLVAPGKQALDELLAAQSLTLIECISSFFHHYIIKKTEVLQHKVTTLWLQNPRNIGTI